MCLLLLAHQAHPDYPLIIAANRDEFYERPTAPLAFWDDIPEVLAGKDLRSGGTWLGITQEGRIAAVTNFRDPTSQRPNAPSRGQLVKDFLAGMESPAAYLAGLVPNARAYNGFNLVLGTVQEMWWYSNRGEGMQRITPGIHGLSNHLLDTPWPKVKQGKRTLTKILSQGPTSLEQALFEMLADPSTAPDHLLPDTGVGLKKERMLSPIFITSPDYGTRSSTLLFIDYQGRVTVTERTYDAGAATTPEVRYEFTIPAGNRQVCP
ncbi:MAG: NRDE family protein [Desulfatiglandaceae bacterium]